MNAPVVRELTEKDYDGVRRVDELTQRQYIGVTWDLLSDEHKDEHLVSRRSDFPFYLRTGYCFVARISNQIIAFLFAYEMLPFRREIIISYIGVCPEHQGRGVALLLYKRMIEKARRNGVKEITALINMDNPYSIRLHEKAGFVLQDRKEAKLKLK